MAGKFFCVVLACMLTACASNEHLAPVSDISTLQSIPHSGYHRVARGETLYAIAWGYGFDYRDLAKKNHLSPPYHLQAGQKILVSSDQIPIMARRGAPMIDLNEERRQSTDKPSQPVTSYGRADQAWLWPAKGQIVQKFSRLNNGIDLRAPFGSPVIAAKSGMVVYSGNGLRGYGNLIIIKHNPIYLSAYAYHRQNLVKEGEWVKKGQKIAEVGNLRASGPRLHFEIRQGGKPVNPISLLPS